MPIKKTFKKRILESIGDKRPSTWARSIGLNNGVIARIFAQGKVPTAPHLITISKALGKSIDWLLTGDEPYSKQPVEFKLNTMRQGEIVEKQAGYYSGSHEEVVNKLIEILEGRNRSNAVAIKQNVDAFHQTKDILIPAKEEGFNDTNDGGILKKNKKSGENRRKSG